MVTNQAYLFLIFIVNGILIGLLFDFFRILRKAFKTNNFITYLEDIIFWIITGIIVLYSIFVFNNGEIRLFMFLGILLGGILYMLFISSHIIKINLKIINIIKKVFKIILIPFSFIFKKLEKIILRPITFIIINTRKSSTNLYNKIYNKIKIFKKEKNIVKS